MEPSSRSANRRPSTRIQRVHKRRRSSGSSRPRAGSALLFLGGSVAAPLSYCKNFHSNLSVCRCAGHPCGSYVSGELSAREGFRLLSIGVRLPHKKKPRENIFAGLGEPAELIVV